MFQLTLYNRHQHVYSPYCSLYIPPETNKKNLLNNHELFLNGDRFLYSRDPEVCFNSDVTKRNWLLVTLRNQGLRKQKPYHKFFS